MCFSQQAAGVERSTPVATKQTQGTNFRNFLGLTFCNVGWTGPDCSQRIHTPACGPRDDRCFYHPQYGTAVVSRERWLSAQRVQQKTWETRDTDVDRNEAHKVSFDGYSSLPQNLGHTMEVACGPFTQVKTILGSGHTVDSLTLLDSAAFHYMDKARRPSYKSGVLQAAGVNTTTIMSFPAEQMLHLTESYDTVVMINVIEHVQDAFLAFENVYRALRPGGLFIWHDHLWDAYTGRPGTGPRDGGALREFELHPVRLKTSFADRFTQMFDSVYDTRDTPELRQLENQGIYFIGRRKLTDGLPRMVLGPPSGTGLTLVLATHPQSMRTPALIRLIKTYHAMPIVRNIVLILNGGAARHLKLEPFASKLILKTFTTNSMNNRFRISREVTTEAVLILDDDVELKEHLLRCLFNQWAREKERIVGTDPRLVVDGDYDFHVSEQNHDGQYNFVIGKTMLFHRRYLDVFVGDDGLVGYINPEERSPAGASGELHFCEDLAMVALVAKLTGKAPVAVDPGRLSSELDTKGGLSKDPQWVATRGACGEWLSNYFNMSFPTETERPNCPRRK
jgi:SAM-dependent methyltransferase